jgi:hypothetical protein
MKPTLGDEAFHGLPGEFVRTVDPYSEADPAAVLLTFLTTFGCYVGPSPRILAGGVHTARLHTLIVGRSAKARKGSSYYPVGQVFDAIDADWTEKQIIGGFGSGEAVITAADDGDPRVLIREEEFAKILAIAARQGSTISQLLRGAWDSGRLERRLAGSTQIVTGAHIALLAHVTIGELLEKLAATDVSGGTVNRLLLVAAGRSKRLSRGATLPAHEVQRLARLTRDAVDQARRIAEMRYTPAGGALWDAMYEHLSDDDPPGPLGDAIARAEPQVLRLSIIYAIADGSSEIDVPHLAAAYTVWQYARQTAAGIFPSRATSDDETKLLAALTEAGDGGMTADQTRDVFSRHRTAEQMSQMMDNLREAGLIISREVPTGGRPMRLTTITAKGASSANSAVTGRPSPLPALPALFAQVHTTGEVAA